MTASLLIANRGEIAIRIARSAAELGLRTIGVYAEDDAACLHTRVVDEARPLSASGAAAYLDVEALVAVARETGCQAVHPGYGFVSENAAFARACADAGVTFVGPRPETLELLGDKLQARALAERCGVPVLPATPADTSLAVAEAFLQAQEGAAVVIKAVAGGGGRGMRVVQTPAELAAAHERCRSEAAAAFGNPAVYVERLLPRARHIEVQILGDHQGQVAHLGERECSLQRRHQKLLEVAPSPSLTPALRERILEAALNLANAASFTSLGTFEFLVDASAGADAPFFFIEANPRLQVEHTVTEAVTGVDLVRAQLELAEGKSLSALGLDAAQAPAARGFAIQARVNMETMTPDGTAKPSGGTLLAFDAPGGPGVRVDSFGYTGYTCSRRYDSLLAKVIVHSNAPGFQETVNRTLRALSEFRTDGVPTNISFLQSLLAHPAMDGFAVHTRFVDEHAAELVAKADYKARHFVADATPAASELAGAKVDTRDPLAVLAHGKSDSSGPSRAPSRAAEGSAPVPAPEGPAGSFAVVAPMQGTVLSLHVALGDAVHQGQTLAVMEAMKMEHVVTAPHGGIVRKLAIAEGDAVYEGHALLFLEPAEVEAAGSSAAEEVDLDYIRPDLQEVIDRHAYGLDDKRPDAVAKRRKVGLRTARENIADLVDEGSFVEYGSLAIAGQRRRRSEQELIERTPADGLVTGLGRVNGELFDDERAQCLVMSYDYTVLAGTQGMQNHRKKDRMFELAERLRLPVVIFTEGGGGRPGDTDGSGISGLDCMAFALYGKLSGLVPLVGIATGRCFAGNAALLGCCDVVIATEGSNIGMGGPAMIEGGGLGVFRPEEIGPLEVQASNGVVDVAVADEAEAVAVAKRYLSYFQGPLSHYECADQRRLRSLIPENRKRIYDVRTVIETLCDTDSVLELRRGFAHGMATALGRIAGRPIGIIANDPGHLAGAIDSDAADKASRFMQLCDAYDIPILFLCDTPGIMVGPQAEKTALVRHAARMFVTGASLSVPFFTIVLRKGYGLGAQLMAGGSFKVPYFLVGWPTAEFGGMGLEGAIKLAMRKELAAIEDVEERKQTFDKLVALAYERGKGVNAASYFEFDDIIDPMTSRDWILGALRSAPRPARRAGKKRPCVDTW